MNNVDLFGTTLNQGDPGDDTLERYKYQIIQSAIFSIGILLENNSIEEVFCEHHEDVLIKLSSGNYSPVQIKTRKLEYGPFKFNDEVVISSLLKFIKLNRSNGSRIEKFIFLSNCSFFNEKENTNNLNHAILEAGKELPVEFEKRFKRLINKFKKLDPSVTCDELISVLKKLHLNGNAGNIGDVGNRLVEALSKLKSLKNKPIKLLRDIADKLILIHFQASSNFKSNLIQDYFVFDENPEKANNTSLINGKRITKTLLSEKIGELIEEEELDWFSSTPSFLNTNNTGTEKLEIKLKRGNVSDDNIGQMRDSKYSMEHLFSNWIVKYGPEKASQRYEKIRSIVRNSSQYSYDLHFSGSEPFGTKMLTELRGKLEKRFEIDRQGCFNCSPENMLGMAGIITEECKLWWSEKFDLS